MSWILMTGLLSACGVMNSARPLPPGQHAVGLTVGGPMLSTGGLVLPLPNAVFEGRSGLPNLLGRNLDVNYGLNLTAIAFGQVGLHLGGSWQLIGQKSWRPALSITDRLYLYTNALDSTKDSREGWALNELVVTGSYALGNQLVYFGLSEGYDFGTRRLLISPSMGFQAAPKSDRFRFQLEAKWYAVNRLPDASNIHWVTPGRGAIGISAGVAVKLGGNP
jgi:hypothetical protein